MVGVLLFLDLVKYFLGEPYFAGLKVVPVLLLANVLLGIYYNLSVWYRLKDKTMLGAWISFGGAAITVLLNVVLVPRVGYIGAAWTALATYFFICLATWYTGRHYYPVRYPFGAMAYYIGTALGLYGLSEWLETILPTSGILMWAIRAALFGAYLSLIYFTERKELQRR